jgi:hypothetical protein
MIYERSFNHNEITDRDGNEYQVTNASLLIEAQRITALLEEMAVMMTIANERLAVIKEAIHANR